MRPAFGFLGALTLAVMLAGQDSLAGRQVVIDRLTADPDTKFQVLDAMAKDLGTHRNRLILLKKETGQSFADIYAAELRKRGATEQAIMEKLRMVSDRVASGTAGQAESASLRPIAYIGSTIDRNSAGTFITLAPEIGLDFGKFAFAGGVPIYRIATAQRDSTGIGDAYVSAFLRQPVRKYGLGAVFTVGAPTGSKERGLGAGRVTVDLNGTVQRRLESLRPFVTGGFTNSTFNNVGYQRPFISNGKAFYASGGVDYTIRRRLMAGIGGFALRALGTQTVISQMASTPQTGGAPGHGMPGIPGMGNGSAGNALVISGMPVFGRAPIASVPAGDVSDHGVTGWLSWSPHPDITLSLRLARSVPYELTTVRIGIGFDVSRPLSRLWR